MRRVFRVLMLLGLAGILFALPVLAAYSAKIQVTESSTTSYTELPIRAAVDNDYLVANGYITATGLDTRVEAGGVPVPHLVADDKLLFVSSISANTTANFQYTTGNTAEADMPVIVGYNGYVTTIDALALELGNNFEIEWGGYIDTTAGADKNLVIKTNSFRTYIAASENVTCILYDTGGALTETLRPTGAGTLTELTPSAGANWDCVEEVATDEDATYVGQLAQQVAYEYDLYQMANSGIGTGAINSVTVYNRVRGTAANQEFFRTYIRTGGANYQGVQTEVPIGYANYSTVYANNPGGGTWTWAQVDALEAGIGMVNPSVAPRETRCTQVWIVVNYSPLFIATQVSATGVSPGPHIVTVKTELRTETFYSDAGVNSVDGYANHSIALGTLLWNDLTTGVGTDAQDGFTSMLVRWDNHADVNEYKRLDRAITLFDTSALPDTAVPVSAILSVWGYGKADPQNNTPDINVYASAPVADNALVMGDYDSLGAVAFSDNITYAGFNAAGYNDFALNASGLAVIDVAGVSKFGLRNTNYDVDNIAPVWAAGTTTQFQMRTVEMGAGFAPKLEVSYYELVIYIDTIEEDRETLAISALDNINNWVVNQNNVMPYMDYYEHTVGGTLIAHYQPVTIISGTVLPDREGAAQNGVITWGNNPAGIAVTIGGMVSESQPTPSITGGDEVVADIAPVIAQPANYLTGRDMSGHPLYALVKPLADLSGFNESWIWIVSATIIVLAGMIWILAKLKSQLLGGIAGFALIALFYSMGIYPFWVLIVYSLIAVAIVVFEKVQAV